MANSITTYISSTDITSIEVEGFEINYSYKYLERKKFLGITLRKGGLYRNPHTLIKERVLTLPSHSVRMQVGDLVFYKPNVQIRCKNHFFQKYFDTYPEAQKYAKDMADKYGLILI